MAPRQSKFNAANPFPPAPLGWAALMSWLQRHTTPRRGHKSCHVGQLSGGRVRGRPAAAARAASSRGPGVNVNRCWRTEYQRPDNAARHNNRLACTRRSGFHTLPTMAIGMTHLHVLHPASGSMRRPLREQQDSPSLKAGIVTDRQLEGAPSQALQPQLRART